MSDSDEKRVAWVRGGNEYFVFRYRLDRKTENTDTYNSLEEALSEIETTKYDLIVVEPEIPVDSSREQINYERSQEHSLDLIKKIRDSNLNSGTPIIALHSYGQVHKSNGNDFGQEYKNAGANLYVARHVPLALDTFTKELEKILDKERISEEIFSES